MYISLGAACNVKYQIDKHTKNSQVTHFFDWLMTSFESVNQLMSAASIEPFLDPSTFTSEIRRDGKKIPRYTITLTKFHSCVSIHDVAGRDYDKTVIDAFVEKYKRRYERLMEEIKADRKTVFIYNGDITDEQAKEFVKNILRINPSCLFTLVILGSQTEPLEDHVLRLKLSEKTPSKGAFAWHDEARNWNDLWSLNLLGSVEKDSKKSYP
jgi:hypothetical protein